RRAAVEENIKKYEWARDELELYKRYCETYLNGFDALYNAIIGEGVPRSNQVGEFTDITDYAFCRYCGEDIDGKYTVSMYSRQWKVQCPECKRLFPSNDFEKFLALGIEEDGTFNREKALVANGKLCGTIAEDGTVIDEENPYGYGVSKGYLYNETYSELRTEGNALYNKDPRTGEKADGNVWGVDDGMGYRPDGMYKNSKVSSRHTYAAYYLHTALIEVHRAIKWLSTVYAYTGDEAYGVKGAILLDRLADVYPTFHFKQYYNDDYKFFVSHGNTGFGKIFGCINDCEYTFTCLRAADALYPLLESENEALISVLSSKANEYGYINRNEDGSINEKKSGSEIWHSWENKLVREAYRAVNEADLEGNYGQVQKVVATAALVLDSEPESKQMVDWIFRYGETKYSGDKASQTGGLLSSKLIDDVDRDGMGDEAAPGYNIGWLTDLYDTAEVLELYGNPEYNLFANAKFAKMFTAGIPVALVDTHTAQIGDTQATANIGFSTDMQIMVNGFKQLRNTRLGKELAEYIYRTNGYSVKGLHYDIYTFDSTSVQRDIADMIDDDVAAKSEMMPGYGFAVLRDGGAYGDIGTSTYTNNMRDFWIYFGRNEGHGHWDTLNLGIEAYGLNFSPDNGTPEKKSNNRPRYQWTEATLAHNTVNVNALRQLPSGYHGTPLHFDDSGDVKLMDVDASQVYSEASVYRRTLVMINAGPDTSYAVDFFRVKGGNEQIYSFHAQSDSAEFDEIDISKVVSQTDEQTGEYIGSYEGRDVPWDVRMDQTEKTTQFENIGKSMLGEVRRAGEDALSGDTFAVDFRISDFNKVLKSGSKGLRMRLTMLNDDNDNVVTELALAKGKNTGNASNGKIPDFEYALVKREGEN
ncbi:MAG: heparinase II/III family protein, partial [Oscillospiraceae bacterium]|nr:heparinase II/III family protein [Oscillospiraceae bacterium]